MVDTYKWHMVIDRLLKLVAVLVYICIFQGVWTIATNNNPLSPLSFTLPIWWWRARIASRHETGRYLAVRHNIVATNEVGTRSWKSDETMDREEYSGNRVSFSNLPAPYYLPPPFRPPSHPLSCFSCYFAMTKFIASNSKQFSHLNPNFSSCHKPVSISTFKNFT